MSADASAHETEERGASTENIARRPQHVPQKHPLPRRGHDALVKVDEHGAVVAPLDVRLDVRGFEPGHEPGGREDEVDARAVVRVACGEFGVPAWNE